MSKLPALYQIADTYLAVLDSEDEYTDATADELEALAGSLQEKAASVAGYVEHLSDTAAAYRARAEKLTQAARTLENREKWLKDYLRWNMERIGVTKIEWGSHRITLAKNPPSCEPVEPSLTPERFLVPQEPKTDRRGILAALKAGEDVPGWRLADPRFNVRIR